MSSQKPHRIRVRVIDGKPREHNKLKGQLVPYVDVLDAKDKVEFDQFMAERRARSDSSS